VTALGWVLVAVGAAVGAPLRYVAAEWLDARLPWGTIAVNWAGSLLLGWCSGRGLSPDPMALLGTGFCGGLTTFSAFAVHTHERGPRLGTANVLLTVVPALGLCWLGFVAA
jgi:CrcB protein